MMKNDFSWCLPRPRLSVIAWFGLLTIALLTMACAHDAMPMKQMKQYDAGSKTLDDLESLLKGDARVQDYSIEDSQLIVNVNERFTAQPYGLQQRALGQWYNVWQAANSGVKNSVVIAQSNGEEIAKWTANEGYKPKVKPKEKEAAE
ncbi:MAG: hypothetical protein HY231_03935 [Acidobacteria bacterium]|nr:hypothetical protein [Acidobacteriota bacterium]